MIEILKAVASLGILGLVFGAVLGIAGKIFAVKTDERVEKIVDALPGANCGGCGYSGCGACAEAIVEGKAKVSACPVGGDKTAEIIAEVMGVKADNTVRYRAVVGCVGTCEHVKTNYIYEGDADCRSAILLGGGDKACNFGCLGLGSCVKACKFNAIKIVDGVAVIDPDLCVACGMCAEACPKNIISLIPYDEKFWVLCANKDKGPKTRENCEKGCIGCKICEKNCLTGAIKVDGFLAKIDYNKCTNCGICSEKCPRKIIVNYKADTEQIKEQNEKIENKEYKDAQ